MGNLKYHMMNILAVMLFSYATASTVNQGVKYYFRENLRQSRSQSVARELRKKIRKEHHDTSIEDYRQAIIGSGFFRIAGEGEGEETVEVTPEVAIGDLFLVGTITGHKSIARAMIRNRRERDPDVFRLRQEVYGYRLVRIARDRVWLKLGDHVEKIGIYDRHEKPLPGNNRAAATKSNGSVIRKNISRAEIKQRVLNNLDNAMRGLVAGPYRQGGTITGFQLKKVRPYNILYKLGARSGDIVKRINGRKVDSVNRLYSMWQNLQSESRIVIDLDRRGRELQFEFNIHE